LRNAVLALAPKAEFARRMINSGRLSVATVYDTSLSTPDESPFAGSARLGAPLPDCPVRNPDGSAGHLLETLDDGFTLLTFKNGASSQSAPDGVSRVSIGEDLADPDGVLTQRLDATPGAAYLLRPDQHLCARWRCLDRGKVAAARDRALGKV
jgi:3-(3-hydroxy-phenyl)propionate hydroxylase